MMKNTKKKNARRARTVKERQSRSSSIWILIVVVFLVGILAFQTHNLKQKNERYQERVSSLETQIAEEKEKAEQLEEEGKLQKTLKYIEKIAREKLGLVYPDEVIVSPED